MILRPFRRRAENRTIASLYGMIVAQARSKSFYSDYGVPDTVQGRFDLIVLHLVLLIRRLTPTESSTPQRGGGQNIGQRLFDAFCRDLDDNLREMAIGDLAVPKHMRRFGEAFYGRQAAYIAALGAEDQEAFENALARNIFGGDGIESEAGRLARYARALVRELDVQAEDTLLRGELAFPRPEAFVDA
ncbi:MAG: ubiquinol-cytochrome C chaperone family protein [Xanthobacteraceae bacterium]